MNRKHFAALVALFTAAALVTAADWPQWRGPNRDGVSKETDLLKEWPSGGPKLLWQVKDLGDGYSTPAVVSDRLYVLASSGMDDTIQRTEPLDRSVDGRAKRRLVGDIGREKEDFRAEFLER